jgi:hypothetical protein
MTTATAPATARHFSFFAQKDIQSGRGLLSVLPAVVAGMKRLRWATCRILGVSAVWLSPGVAIWAGGVTMGP